MTRPPVLIQKIKTIKYPKKEKKLPIHDVHQSSDVEMLK